MPLPTLTSFFAWCRGRLRSFRYALQGLGMMLRGQPNARIHAVMTLAVIGLGVWTGLNLVEWAILALAVGGVWAAEGLNTALEELADHLHPDHHRAIGRVKDIAAAGVLLMAVASAVAGLLVFWPHWF